MTMNTFQNYIGGRWCDSGGGQTFDDVNPADTDQVVARCQQSTADDMHQAVTAAAAAFPAWRAVPPAKRAEILQRALARMLEHCDEFARDLTLENGKTLAESRAEIVSAAKEMAYQIAEGVRVGGRTVASEQPGVFCFSTRQPLGVVGIITPWNFPFNVVCRKAIPALMAGNTIVFKPASFTPLTGVHYTQLFDEAGLPPGVLNLVTGQGAAIGDALVEHPLVRAISFTGSTPVGRAIERKAVAHGAKAQMEIGRQESGRRVGRCRPPASRGGHPPGRLRLRRTMVHLHQSGRRDGIGRRRAHPPAGRRGQAVRRRQRVGPQDHDGPRGRPEPIAHGPGIYRNRQARRSRDCCWAESAGRPTVANAALSSPPPSSPT